jgi:hypothetical protein
MKPRLEVEACSDDGAVGVLRSAMLLGVVGVVIVWFLSGELP